MRIIAEIGINHNGSFDTARDLILAASDAGVDAVKFQYRNLNNAYTDSPREIGDEILMREIKKNFLAPDAICALTMVAKDAGLEVGISFFEETDVQDFGKDIKIFDFFKVPSAELTNSSLIDLLASLGKHLYLSLGAHSEVEIENALRRLSKNDWTPLHCVSNYPVALHNAKLGYIPYLREKWGRPIGYSSHDEHWEACLIAMQLGATVLERHITFDKHSDGLDNSSSSTPAEFRTLVEFSKNFLDMNAGNESRRANQGELINRQNLGRSYYAKVDMEQDEILKLDDLVYRSPYVGLSKSSIGIYLGKNLRKNVKAGSVITTSDFEETRKLSAHTIDVARTLSLALPVRLHDYDQFSTMFPLNSFEFHLSFEEVLGDIDFNMISKSSRYSVHLPDYVSSRFLMDPFSEDKGQRLQSLSILERTVELARKLQSITNNDVPVVGSFSALHIGRDDFYQAHNELFESIATKGVSVIPQWLPPFAWYFGGSVKLGVMNSLEDIPFLEQHEMNLCMDISHLFMGSKYFGFSSIEVFERLIGRTKHLHIADASGIDGEGFDIGSGDLGNLAVIKESLNRSCMKVIEVWQGHLNNGTGFGQAIEKLVAIYEN